MSQIAGWIVPVRTTGFLAHAGEGSDNAGARGLRARSGWFILDYTRLVHQTAGVLPHRWRHPVLSNVVHLLFLGENFIVSCICSGRQPMKWQPSCPVMDFDAQWAR